MLEAAHSIFLITWEILCCKIFYEAFTEKKYKINQIHGYLLLVVLVMADFGFIILLGDNFFWKELFVILTGSFVMWRYFHLKYSKALVLYLLFQGGGLIIDYVVIIVLFRAFPEISTNILEVPLVNILATIIGKTLLFCCVIFIRKSVGTKNTDVLTANEWLRFSMVPLFTVTAIISIIMNWSFVDTKEQENILLCISFGLLTMNIIMFYLISDILKREIQIREDKIFRERLKNETKNNDNQRRWVHEYKNQLSCIMELIKNKNYEELNRYIKKIDDKIFADSDMIDTNHVIVNAIINSKYREGRKKGIAFVFQVNDLSDLGVEDEDIVIILSNLLNNAIEASEKCAKKIIKLKFVKEKGNIFISVVNTMMEMPQIVNGRFQTSKRKDKENHGIGIENIISAIEKYNGSYVIHPNDKEFHFTIRMSTP